MNSNITEIKASDIKTNKFKVYTSYRTHKLKDGTVAVYKSCKTYNYVPRNGDGRAAQKRRTEQKNEIKKMISKCHNADIIKAIHAYIQTKITPNYQV